MAANKDPKSYSEVRNSKALRDYAVDERFEAGIQLRGTEVKSIRAGKAQINDAFARVEKGEVWLYNAHIEQYAFGNMHNHDAKRIRKLLLHRRHIEKIRVALEARVLATHPYETPEWLVVRAERVGEKYLSWATTNSSTPPL